MGSVLEFVGKLTALAVLALAMATALLPKLFYTDLPTDLTLDLTTPTTIVITGANSGLGLATVQHFAHNEMATIIMACRSQTRCELAAQQVQQQQVKVKATLHPMVLDLSQKSSIEAFANELQGQPVHILINNAGLVAATEELFYHKDDGVENHIRVNHLGHFYLTHCLWNNLLQAPRARVVAVSSLAGALATSVPTQGWYKNEGDDVSLVHQGNFKMYARSKRANLFFANELQLRYANDPRMSTVTVTAAHPGLTHTDLCKNGCKSKKSSFFRTVANLDLLTGTIKQSAEDGALSQAYAAVIPQSGVYIGPSLGLVGVPKILGRLSSSWHHMAFTRDESKFLWGKSMEAMEIKNFGDYTNESPAAHEEEGGEEGQEGEPEQPQQQHQQTNSVEEPIALGERQLDGSETETEDDKDSSEDEEADELLNSYLGDGAHREAVVM